MLCYGHKRESLVYIDRILTVTPYFSAIPCNVSPSTTACLMKWSWRLKWLQVLPYFFRDLAESLIDRLSSFFPSAILFYAKSWNGPLLRFHTYCLYHPLLFVLIVHLLHGFMWPRSYESLLLSQSKVPVCFRSSWLLFPVVVVHVFMIFMWGVF